MFTFTENIISNMKTLLKNAWLHFKKICVHKYWVARYCFACGLYWQGIIHDLSKFSFVEFSEAVKYYCGTGSPINACRKQNGYSMAWLHHKGRNKHHYEYWVDKFEPEQIRCVCMPKKYLVELVCDYLGAARAYMDGEFSYEKERSWWRKKRRKIVGMSESAKMFISNVFDDLYWIESKSLKVDKDDFRYIIESNLCDYKEG